MQPAARAGPVVRVRGTSPSTGSGPGIMRVTDATRIRNHPSRPQPRPRGRRAALMPVFRQALSGLNLSEARVPVSDLPGPVALGSRIGLVPATSLRFSLRLFFSLSLHPGLFSPGLTRPPLRLTPYVAQPGVTPLKFNLSSSQCCGGSRGGRNRDRHGDGCRAGPQPRPGARAA